MCREARLASRVALALSRVRIALAVRPCFADNAPHIFGSRSKLQEDAAVLPQLFGNGNRIRIFYQGSGDEFDQLFIVTGPLEKSGPPRSPVLDQTRQACLNLAQTP